MYNLKEQIAKEIIDNKQKEMINFLNKLDKTPVSTKPFWQRVNQTRKKNNNLDSIPTIKDGIEYKTVQEKASIFAEKLKNTSNESDPSDFDNDYKQKIDEIISSKQYEAKYDNKETVRITMLELSKAIMKLNNSKSMDSTGFSNFLIKKLPMNSRIGLLNLFNQCLVDNELPDEWKTAEVTMLHKKDKNKKDINNYRPISKTPCVAKLFERIISVRLWDFLKEKKIIISCQSGFRQNRQTKDNIFHLTQKATEALNRSNKLCAIFFDIAAAFDKVWHNGLIYKLAQLECPLYLVRFFVSFP